MRSFILAFALIFCAGTAQADQLARHLLVYSGPNLTEEETDEIIRTLQACKDAFLARLGDLGQLEVSQRQDSSAAVASITNAEWSGALIAAAAIEICGRAAGLKGVHLMPQAAPIEVPLLD